MFHLFLVCGFQAHGFQMLHLESGVQLIHKHFDQIIDLNPLSSVNEQCMMPGSFQAFSSLLLYIQLTYSFKG